MEAVVLFGYACPECGLGTVRATKVQNYKTKIKGYPFIVDEALIGICDHCRAKHFTPKETQRWEELFSAALEARRAFLSPQEIAELRHNLGLSMEDFARLIGCTRQSIYNWERTNRASPPSRTADLLMRLVRESYRSGIVDVISYLLEEAKKWAVTIEVRRSSMPLEEDGGRVLRARMVNEGGFLQQAGDFRDNAEI
jgi:putative zinc finger/helix-turn-helix YgiT family protein